MSSTQRSQIYREKLKLAENTEKLASYKVKQNEYYRKHVEKQNENHETANKFKQNARDRKRKSREKLNSEKEIYNGPSTSAFNSISSRSKAVTKCLNSLPSNHEKKQEVLAICAKRFKVTNSKSDEILTRKRNNGFIQIETAVIDFFSIDLISKQLPGIRDFVTSKNSLGENIQLQKRVLLMSLSDAYNEFVKSFPNLKISYSKFCKLRPKNISLFSTEVHYSCLCIHCENMKLLLEGLAGFVTSIKLTLDILMTKITCHSQNFRCVSGICQECVDAETALMQMLRSCCLDEITKFKEWKKCEGYMQKVLVENVTVKDVLNIILKKLKDFKMHHYIKNVQRDFFSLSKSCQDSDCVTIVVDFAENFATKSQCEVQSSYFGRKQITLFTAVAWIAQSHERSFVIASNNSRHSKEQVAVYMKRIFLKLKEEFSFLSQARIFSDGAGSQFKNHFIMSSMLHGIQYYGFKLEWHFFATSHGKSSADGLGGTIKRGVYNRMLTGQWDIYSANDFVLCSLSFVKNIEVFEVTQNEVNDEIKMIEKKWNESKNLAGMQSRHYFKPSDKENYILMAKSSLGDDINEIKIF